MKFLKIIFAVLFVLIVFVPGMKLAAHWHHEHTPAPLVTVTVSVYPANSGSAVVSPSGSVRSGTIVTISATPGYCRVFRGWFEGNTLVSRNLTATINANRNRHIVAHFYPTVSIYYGDTLIVFESFCPIIRNSRTFVPLRELFEVLGFTTQYLGGGQISITNNIITIIINIGEYFFTVNDRIYFFEEPLFVHSGVAFIHPIFILRDILGYYIEWEAAAGTNILRIIPVEHHLCAIPPVAAFVIFPWGDIWHVNVPIIRRYGARLYDFTEIIRHLGGNMSLNGIYVRGNILNFIEGSRDAQLNGSFVSLRVSPVLHDNRIFLSFRDLIPLLQLPVAHFVDIGSENARDGVINMVDTTIELDVGRQERTLLPIIEIDGLRWINLFVWGAVESVILYNGGGRVEFFEGGLAMPIIRFNFNSLSITIDNVLHQLDEHPRLIDGHVFFPLDSFFRVLNYSVIEEHPPEPPHSALIVYTYDVYIPPDSVSHVQGINIPSEGLNWFFILTIIVIVLFVLFVLFLIIFFTRRRRNTRYIYPNIPHGYVEPNNFGRQGIMPQANTCTCGTDCPPGSKFCRSCGKAVVPVYA